MWLLGMCFIWVLVLCSCVVICVVSVLDSVRLMLVSVFLWLNEL